MVDIFLEELATVARNAYIDYFNKHFPELASFCESNCKEECLPSFYNSRAIHITDYSYINSVHQWKRRMREEARQITRNIIVSLELGGTKSDLDRMLSEIGES